MHERFSLQVPITPDITHLTPDDRALSRVTSRICSTQVQLYGINGTYSSSCNSIEIVSHQKCLESRNQGGSIQKKSIESVGYSSYSDRLWLQFNSSASPRNLTSYTENYQCCQLSITSYTRNFQMMQMNPNNAQNNLIPTLGPSI